MELKEKLIEQARKATENSVAEIAVGCSLLTDDNIIFSGCQIDTYTAPLVTILKAMSEGYTRFSAICLWSAKSEPKIDRHAQELLTAFTQNLDTKVFIASGER